MAPDLEGEGGADDEQQIQVREQGDAPDGLGLAARAEGTQQFGEDENGEGLRAGHLHGLRLKAVKIDREGDSRREKAGECHRA